MTYASPSRGDRLWRPIAFARPGRAGASAWLEHIPFAFWLMEAARPRRLVELGTHTGVSYCAFLQAGASLDLNLAATAVDTWSGDAHSGDYGDEVLEELRAYHDVRYAPGSQLLRATFDEALDHVPDASVDLLHIDGCHTYEAVSRDFAAWSTKLSSRGIAIFHDTTERRADFGVWRLWEELAARYPVFGFEHGHGLGLALIGPEAPAAVGWLTALDEGGAADVRAFFSALGARHSAEERERALVAGEHARSAAASEAFQAQAQFLEAQGQRLDAQAQVLDAQAHILDAQAQVLDAQARAMADRPIPGSTADAELVRQAGLIAQQAALISRLRGRVEGRSWNE